MSVRILIGDCRERLAELDPDSIDAAVGDPPYHLTSIVKRFSKSHLDHSPTKDLTKVKAPQYKRLARGFMGQTWDGGDVAFDPDTWRAVYRVLKPGAHLVMFSAPRTYGRMQVAIEDAGFEVRDGLLDIIASDDIVGKFLASLDPEQIGAFCRAIEDSQFGGLLAWVFGSGFPKSHNQAGGWGTALKPAFEPILLARKPLIGTVAANMAAHDTGALNIDGCRIETDELVPADRPRNSMGYQGGNETSVRHAGSGTSNALGRWPANIIHDGSEEVLAHFPETTSGEKAAHHVRTTGKSKNVFNPIPAPVGEVFAGDSGSAARFFYCAKATTEERGEGNNHPTVKPVDLMRWLVRLVTPKGGTVLDPFMGSGSTMIAADAEQFNGIGCELSPEYAEIAERRIRASAGMFAEVLAA